MIEFKDVVRASIEARKSGDKVALASIVKVRGSSPRHNGARMLIWPDGRIVGTIGGGSMEYKVVEDAAEALDQGEPRYCNYVFDASGRPGSVGLCGGSVDVHINTHLADFMDLADRAVEALERGESVVLASVVRQADLVPTGPGTHRLFLAGGQSFGSLGNEELDARVAKDAEAALTERKTRLVTYGQENGITDLDPVAVHLDVLQPDLSLLIIGAGHVAQPLATMGSLMGMRVFVVDDRHEWANPERFPTANEIAVIDYEPINEILAPIPYPMNPSTYVVITTWGYDLPAMEQALQQDPAYIGLVASPTKARVLFKRLQESGFPDEAIRRIKAPIGLDIGAESPAELAVSILGEILVEMRGKTGLPLEQVRGGHIASLFAIAEREAGEAVDLKQGR